MPTISNSNRISGLATGLDVEEIVDGLTKGTKSKIATANQDLQILEWEQDDYRTVTDALYEFTNTYCGSSAFSLSISDKLKTLSATNPGSDYVTVTPSSKSVSGSVYIADIVSLASAAKVQSSSTVSSEPVITVDTGTVANLTGKSMKVSLDGTEKTITFSGTYSTTANVMSDLQTQLDSAFGSGRVTLTQSGDTFSIGSTSSTVTISNIGTIGSEASEVISFTDGASNRIDLSDTLATISLNTPTGSSVEFDINGTSFSFTSDETMLYIMSAINEADVGVKLTYSAISDKFTLASTETGTGSSVTWSDSTGTFLSSILGTGVSTTGTDAVVKVGLNGSTDESSLVTITRSSNTFEIDGSTYTLKNKASGTTAEGISINIGYDTEDLETKIVKFVTDYNELLSTVTGLLSEKEYDDYLPLSDEQKEKMTDDEITAWTKKAKSGMLNSDPYLLSIYRSLRAVWYDPVSNLSTGDSISTSLTDIGLSTGDYKLKGQLEIDEDALLDALNSDPEGVIKLLTQTSSITYSQFNTTAKQETRYNESGILWRVADIMHNNLSTTGTKGALIELVGSPSNSYTGVTSYSKKIDKKEDAIDKLEDKLDDEEDKYWKKFTALEAAMVSFNATSTWLGSAFSN